MLTRCLLLLAALVSLVGESLAVEGPTTRKIVLIAGPKSHGPTGNGIHDYPWSVKLLKVMLDHSNIREQVRVEYHLDGMPRDLTTLDDADSIMVISDGRDGDLYQEAPHFGSVENLKAVQKQIDRGCGFLTFHFSTFAPDQYAQQILDWSGAYFDWETDGKKKWYSAITHKEADIELGSPDHAVLRGIKPFKMKEEFYFNLRFAAEGSPARQSGGETPATPANPRSGERGYEKLSPLFVVPALGGRAPDGNVVAWAKQRANGGRGFGTTCGHFYANWERDEFRKLILNAIAWTAKLDVPKDGVEARYFTHAEITQALAGIEGTARAIIDDKPIRVLLIAGNDAHKWHNWEKTTPAMKSALERDPRIKVDVSLDIEDLIKKDIAQNYDLLLSNYVNWHDPKPLSDASKTAFMNFVQHGGGVLFVHFNSSAFHFSLPMAAESDWPELRKIAIRAWNHQGKDEAKSGHDAFGPFKVDVTSIEHPITAGLKGFDVVDELYFKQDGRPVDPLITAKSKVTGRDEPLAFVGSYGKGRVFQTLLGHSEKTYDVFEPREMLRRAAAWAANRRVLKLRAEDDPNSESSERQGASRRSPTEPALAPAASALRLTQGKFGQALDARATGVSIDAKPEQRNVPLTVECWTKLGSKDGFNILIASEPKSAATHWEMYSYAGSGLFSVYLPGCGGEYRSDVNIADDQWHHVAMTLEAKRIRLFVDGKVAVDKALPNEFAAAKDGALAIGRLVEGGIGCAGLIDEVRVRRGAHSIEGVPEKAPLVDDNTVGLWRFDEIVEQTKLKDESKSATPAMAQAPVPAPAAQAAATGKPKPPAHWGKEQIGFDQWEGDWVDNRWKESNIGRWLSSVVALPGGAGRKMTSIRVGDQQPVTVCFDAEHAQLRAIWTGGFLKFNPARFGIIGAPSPDGELLFNSGDGAGWLDAEVRYRGMHSHGERVVLSYSVNGIDVSESPWVEQLDGATIITRTMEIGPGDKPLVLRAFDRKGEGSVGAIGDRATGFIQENGQQWEVAAVGWTKVAAASAKTTGGNAEVRFLIPPRTEPVRLRLLYWTGKAEDQSDSHRAFLKLVAKDDSISDLAALKKPAPAKWTEKIETEFVAAPNDAPYVIDTFKLPFDNPYKSLLFTSGHDFFSNGDIAVCTVHGDVWRVKGGRVEGEELGSEKKRSIRWQRIATGLHQPLGLVITRATSSPSALPLSTLHSSADSVYVLGRDQITRLHDTNNDGETDFYECFSNVYPTSAGGHDYIACLERDSLGNFWFVHANLGIIRVSADGSRFDVISTGLRNPNGMGLGPGDVVTAAPQEGDWTPASAIFVAKPGAHFGGGGPRVTPERPLGFNPPAVWIPRRVDNSSGGQCWVTSDKWGPLAGHMLHFSFGQCSAMLGIRSGNAALSNGNGTDGKNKTDGNHENSAAAINLIPVGLTEFPFRFDSGAMRGRFSPHDGQLYVTGLRGWTTSAVTDGCLQRVRFTGQPIDMPVSSTAYSNGIALTFTEPLDKDAAENPGHFHVEQWNYLYSKTYGSPEYRVSDPKQEGRDEVRVRSATLLDDRTVFLELKEVQPVNMLAISCVLKGRSEATQAPLATSPLPREFRRTIYLTLNSVRAEKFDESKLVRRATTDDAFEASLKPGLIARFANVTSGGNRYDDCRVDRLAATYVSPIHAPSQFLKPGPFVARWEGFLKVPLQQAVTFRIEGTGDAKLLVNDKNIALGKTTLLNGGFNKLAIEYTSPTDGRAAQVRLMWESNEFAREPVPPTVLFHNSENEELIRFQQLRQGRELFASLKCVACHGANDNSPLAPELIHDAPNLAGINRLNRQWAVDWIVDPNKERAGTRMPHLNITPAEAADIAMWLGTKAAKVEPSSKGGNAAEGSVAFEELGCLVCHRLKGDEVDEYSRRSLAHVKDKFATGQLEAFLKEPQRFHPTSHMPDFRLDEATAGVLSVFLLQQTSSPNRTLRHPVSAENGAKLFVDRGCVHCHAVGDQAARPRMELAPLVDVAASQGCLADRPHQRSGVPHYPLTLADRTALLRFLKTDQRSLQQSVPAEAARSLTKGLRCHACHDCDGAISPRRAIIADESDRGRITDVYPNLTWTGEKLQADWMTHFIGGNQTGKSADPPNPLRPWLKGRMPKFPAYASALAAGMAAEHGVNLTAEVMPSPDPQRAELGNLLTQRTALDCRQCHAVGNQPAQGDDKTKIAPGINFALVKERLRYDYYQRFTLDPPRFDINTKMPKLATDGKTTKVTTILEGDARQQFDAIWHFIGTAKLAAE